jgi:putative acyl-CoA dehydrogenase
MLCAASWWEPRKPGGGTMAVIERAHEISNQPPPLEDYNAFEADLALSEALVREGGEWGLDRVRDFGAVTGSAEAREHSRRAQRNIPRLITHDRFGNRVDAIDYDPSFHWMLRLGIEREVASLPWRDPRPGAHVVRAGMFLLMNGLDTGPCCPVSINYAAVPTLRQDATLAAAWEPRATRPDYDSYAQAGMVMTEKQGGSDLRANTTRADPVGDGWYEITGHKWFCTHPVFAFFFTLAQTAGGLSCFVAERPHPGFRIQRLKDKLGGRCLASSEVEFSKLPARLLGEEGRGVATIISQINYTRLDTMTAVAGMVRRMVAEAVHHARHRSAFGGLLAEKLLMQNVLADLAVESEAMTAASLRVARSYDSEDEVAFRRFATAVMKYWISKRGPMAAVEALECLGGNGYVEESIMPQFYRDVEIGTVWEGSGNVAALDVLRAAAREPEGFPAFIEECKLGAGADRRLDEHLARLERRMSTLDGEQRELQARRLVEDMAVGLQASLLVRHAPPAVADAFCAARLGDGGPVFGTLPAGTDLGAIVERALV